MANTKRRTWPVALTLLSGVTGCLPQVTGAGEHGADASAGGDTSPGAGGTPAGSGLGAGAFRYVEDTCQTAVEAACGEELAGCAADGACSAYFSCWFGCEPTELECRAKCTEGPLHDEERALRHCVARSALSACATETLLFDRRGPSCASCAASRCGREVKACLASEGCSRLLGCEASSPSRGPTECDDAIPEEVLTDAALQYDGVVTSCISDVCLTECNEAWGCVGQFNYTTRGFVTGAVSGVFGGTLADGASFVSGPDPAYVDIATYIAGAAPSLAEPIPFDLTACAKDDVLCGSPLQVVTTTNGDSARFDASRIGAPFDGYFLLDGAPVYPGRLQRELPYFAGVPAYEQRLAVLPSDTLDRGFTVPGDFNRDKPFIAGSVGDCAGYPAAGVSITSTLGRLYYLDATNVPSDSAGATDDYARFVVVDLEPGPVTLTARYDGQTVASMTVLMEEGRYSGVHLTPDTRSEQ